MITKKVVTQCLQQSDDSIFGKNNAYYFNVYQRMRATIRYQQVKNGKE